MLQPARFIAVALLFCLTTRSANARLGETQLQHELRYGTAKENVGAPNSATVEPNTVKTYEHQGWRLQVTFVDAFAEQVVYRKYPAAGVTENELRAIMNAEASGTAWREIGLNLWKNSRGSHLSLNPFAHIITVKSAALVAREKAEERAKKLPKPAPEF